MYTHELAMKNEIQLSKVKGCHIRALHKAEVGGINVFYEEKMEDNIIMLK